jgi:hypothetical protein
MVFYNQTALDDVEEIFVGLLEWATKDNQQPMMSFNEVWNYRNDLYKVGNSLDGLLYHSETKFEIHKRYGQYVYRYNRNSRTQWNFVYNKVDNNVFINKIISNYLTIE